ncbi:MAG: hypothetical protein ACT4PY_05745 [Armatimonadota bacterium]
MTPAGASAIDTRVILTASGLRPESEPPGCAAWEAARPASGGESLRPDRRAVPTADTLAAESVTARITRAAALVRMMGARTTISPMPNGVETDDTPPTTRSTVRM